MLPLDQTYQKLESLKIRAFLRSRIIDFFYFAPEFAICGALCAEYHTKSPFFSKTVTATHLQVLPFDPAHQLLPGSVFLGY